MESNEVEGYGASNLANNYGDYDRNLLEDLVNIIET